MRILFMGTPDFASAALEKLYFDGYDVCGVFTQPDKPKNRGMKLEQSPVKKLALTHDTPVYQPTTLRDGTAMQYIKEVDPDIIVVVAYGKILPVEILQYPPYGCINIHGSILPKYRGAAPIQWAVLNGEKTTGVTAMYMAAEMDAGDIIAVKTTKIGTDETAGELFDKLKYIGASLLCDTLDSIALGVDVRVPQDHSMATFAPPLTKEISPVDWNKTAAEIVNKVRGLDPWPAATTALCGIQFKIYKAKKKSEQILKAPGEIVSTGSDGIEIACSDGSVLVTELQAPGGKRMAAADYLRGHPLC